MISLHIKQIQYTVYKLVLPSKTKTAGFMREKRPEAAMETETGGVRGLTLGNPKYHRPPTTQCEGIP